MLEKLKLKENRKKEKEMAYIDYTEAHKQNNTSEQTTCHFCNHSYIVTCIACDLIVKKLVTHSWQLMPRQQFCYNYLVTVFFLPFLQLLHRELIYSSVSL